MGKEMIFFRDSCTRVKDLERENKELVKQGSIDKKTLNTLREVRIAITGFFLGVKLFVFLIFFFF